MGTKKFGTQNWTKKLACEREVGNQSNAFTVAMKKDSVTVGHIPRAILPICSIFYDEVGQSSAGLLELDNILLTYHKVDWNCRVF